MPEVELTVPPLPGRDPVVLRWLVAPGDAVGAGQPLVIMLTDRAEVVLPAPGAGVLVERLVAEGGVAAGVLGRIQKSAVSSRKSEVATPATASSEPSEVATPATMGPGAGGQRDQGWRGCAPQPSAFRPVSPTARRIAAAHGLDLAGVGGSGPGGRVVKADVLAQRQKAEGKRQTGDEAAPHRDTVSDNHAFCLLPFAFCLDLPIITAMVEVDVTAALGVCAAAGAGFARLGLGVSLTTYVAWAAAGLLAEHPALQSCWGAEGLVRRRRTHLAVAEAEGDGLRWALVRHAGDLTLRGMARAVRDGAAGDLGGATFSVVGLAGGPIRQIAAPPLAKTGAALSVGAPWLTPVATSEGAIVARQLSRLSISFDARAIDYGQAMALLRALRAAVERGDR